MRCLNFDAVPFPGKDILKAAVSSNCSAEVVTILANTQLERAGLPQIPTISDPCFAIFKLLFGVEYHEKPDWDSITRIVKDNLGTIVFELSPKRESFLNLLLQHNPPLKLVQEVIAANPSALSIQRRLPPDGYNSDLPIFVAWKRGLPGALIRIIAEGCPYFATLWPFSYIIVMVCFSILLLQLIPGHFIDETVKVEQLLCSLCARFVDLIC